MTENSSGNVQVRKTPDSINYDGKAVEYDDYKKAKEERTDSE